MPKKLMQCQSICITIKNSNIKDWNPKSIPIFLTILGIQEAIQLKQSNNPDVWFTIGFLEKLIILKKTILPRWMNKLREIKDILPIIDELKEYCGEKCRGIGTYPDNIELFDIPVEFDFEILTPEGSPRTNIKNWLIWCFSIKLLIYYSSDAYPMNLFAIRGLCDKNINVYPSKNLALELILSHFEQIFPKIVEPNFPFFPKYLPPYIEMERREELWSHSKKKSVIDLRKMVWFNVLAYISRSEEINPESVLGGINSLIGLYKRNNDMNLVNVIGNCLGLIFNNFPDFSI